MGFPIIKLALVYSLKAVTMVVSVDKVTREVEEIGATEVETVVAIEVTDLVDLINTDCSSRTLSKTFSSLTFLFLRLILLTSIR